MSKASYAAYANVAEKLEDATALSASAYADPSVFADEVERVFKSGWLPVARESEVPQPGAYRAVDLFGLPLVVTRDSTGALHLLSRVCRHRGMILIEGAGVAKGLTCPYHLWRFGLDGRFAAAPGMDRARLTESHCDLPRHRLETWGGWIFANLDGQAPSLAPQLGPLAERLAPITPESLVTADVIEFDAPWNWKVMAENFLESYHHIGPHADTLQRSNPGLGTYESAGSDAYTVLENPPADGHGAFVVAAVFPTTLMFFTEGETPLGVWYELADLSHAGFRLRIHLLSSPEFAAAPELVAHYRDQVAAIHAEDIAACLGVQRGVTSPLYTPGPLSRLEAPLWRLHRHLQQRLSVSA